jgi:hypothetical protein
LDRRYLFVAHRLAFIVVRDVASIALADRKARLRIRLIQVSLQFLPERKCISSIRRCLDDRRKLLLGNARDDLREAERAVVDEVRKDLRCVLKHVLPVFGVKPRLLFQRSEVSKLASVAEYRNEQVIKLLRLRGPVALDNAGTSPGGPVGCDSALAQIAFLSAAYALAKMVRI